MTPFLILCMACIAGLFTISQSMALISVFDYYFYLLPFGIALTGLFISTGVGRTSFFASINPRILQALPIFGAFTMLMSVVIYLYVPLAGPSLFLLLLVIVQLFTYISIWLAIERGRQLTLSTTGVIGGLTLGYVLIGYLNIDPLVIILIVCVFSAALYLTQFLKQARTIAYILTVCFITFTVFQGRQYQVMPASLGWMLDSGRAEPENIADRNTSKKIWGSAGVSEMYALAMNERAAWLYTNGSSPSLVLTDELASYDNAWWAQKAPLTMAIYDAVQPKSMVDIGMVPSDMAWRALAQSGRKIYGLYGSHDWARVPEPGYDLIRKSVVLLQQPTSSKEKIKFPVDMIVLSSGHEGKDGWVSSNEGEQTFLNQENILSYWQHLNEEGVLVLLARQQSVFIRQIFNVWTALHKAGMSDAQFLDHAWGLVRDTETMNSPYRYALVITKRAKNEKFAQAMRAQVIALPIRYLFGRDLQPTPPYHVFYQHNEKKVQVIFTQAMSGMFGKNMTLEGSSSRKSIPYQFVEDVFPQYKNMLVLSVGILIWIILFPLQKFRRVESIQTLQEPSVAVWMVTGGATGALMTVALAFLIAFPSSVTQEFRLLYLIIMMLVATGLMHVYKDSVTIRPTLLLGFASAIVLMMYLISHFMRLTEVNGMLYIGAAGVLFVLLGVSLPVMQSSWVRDSEAVWLGWWWFAMAAGSAIALFWSMRLYSVLGDDLLLIAGLLTMGIAGVFWWYGHSRTGKIHDTEQKRRTDPAL